ncbi:hypothetical protein Tco_0271438 [Tanacetum coccineum]
MANLDFCDKHNMVAYLQRSEGSEGFHQIIDFLTTSHIRYTLTESLTIYVSLIEQFWQTASASTLENGDMEITATIYGKVKVVYEESIRRHLKLEDSDGTLFPSVEIFDSYHPSLLKYGYQEKDKIKTNPDKTEHENGMSARKRVQRCPRILLGQPFPRHYPPQETSREILQAQEDLMEAIQVFLKEYNHIPPNEKCMALLLAEERFLKIKQPMEEEQNQPEVLQELLLKLINDLQILKGIQQEKKKPTLKFSPYTMDEEFSEYINCPSWNRPLFYFDDDDDEYTIIWRKPKAITPVLPDEIPITSYAWGDDILTLFGNGIVQVIKSSVEILVPIPSELEGISDDTCDVPVCDDSSTFDALNDNYEILSDSNNDDTSSDDDDFEDIEYVSLEEVNDVDQEEKEFNLEDIFQIQDSLSLFPIPVMDMNRSFEESDTSSFSFAPINRVEIDNDNSNEPLLELLEFESFHFDPSFPRPPPEPPDVEICLHFEPDAPVIDQKT